MGKIQSCMYVVCLLCSATLNILFVGRYVYVSGKWEVGWSRRAAEEAEAVAAVSCSGHGRAYLDGLVVDGSPVCECNTCFGGPDCSQFSASCVADVDSGDPLFLEPFWMQHAASSALLVAGWHRMSYSFHDHSLISKELEELIRKLHAIVGNANTTGRFIVFGAGSIQLLNAAVHALSPHNSSAPAKVVATIPFYPVYKSQTDFFQSVDFQFVGDTSLWKNTSDTTSNLIEFVTAPNNPDGKLNKAVLQGPNAKPIYDHAYYWPHFTPIPAPADEDLMIFTFSKLTGHAGSRFGWALIKDKDVYETMSNYMSLNVDGVSRDTQLRAFKLLKVVTRGRGREIFEFGYKTMKDRWEKLNRALLMSRRFSVQESSPQYCTFSGKVKRPSPAYAWLKCEKEEDKECYRVLKKAGIIGRNGTLFSANSSYVRLSLIKTQDDFDILLHQINKLVGEENGGKSSMRRMKSTVS
ncbi:Tryptophan aminotransferase-related protein 4 [Vitis vinifera]|uniref:Tryptophan aminotransferase-related protein 4 n=1 Tax=Vitis vinifera TaxID=29760 RepID=A0A438DPT3_VITVI|nr:Tryptophan aminotransferase-related protein 4 [Vitis vinifera]